MSAFRPSDARGNADFSGDIRYHSGHLHRPGHLHKPPLSDPNWLPGQRWIATGAVLLWRQRWSQLSGIKPNAVAELPLAGLLQDAMAVPLFAGGNIGVRRRQLHALMLDPAYDDLATLDGICLAETVP